MYHIFIIHFRCFYFLANVNRVSVIMAEQVFVGEDIESFWHMSKSGVARSYGRCTLDF